MVQNIRSQIYAAWIKYQKYMSQIVLQEDFEIILTQQVVIPLYFIEWYALLTILPQNQLPIIQYVIENALHQIPNYFSILFNLLIVALFLICAQLPKNINQQFKFIIKVLFCHYEYILLIPLEIIALNHNFYFITDLLIAALSTIFIFIMIIIQNYVFRQLELIPTNLNTQFNIKNITNSLFLLMYIILLNHIDDLNILSLLGAIYILLQIIRQLYWLSYSYTLVSKQVLLINGLILSYYIDVIIKNQIGENDIFLLYSFFALFPVILQVLLSLFNHILQNQSQDGNSFIFCQFLYIYQNTNKDDKECIVKCKILIQIHKNICTSLKCVCKEEKINEMQILKSLLKQNKTLHPIDKIIIELRYMLKTSQHHTEIFSRLKEIQKQPLVGLFYKNITSQIQKICRKKTLENINRLHKQPDIILEMMHLKYQAEKLQKTLTKLLKELILFWDNLSNDKINNYQLLFDRYKIILHMFNQLSQQINNVDQKKETKNLFSLRLKLIVSFLIQDLRMVQNSAKLIDEILSSEAYQAQDFTGLSFAKNSALQIVAYSGDYKRGFFFHKPTQRQLEFFELEPNTQLNQINQIIQEDFKGFHDKLLENYQNSRSLQKIGQQIETYYSVQPYIIVPVYLILTPYFQNSSFDDFLIMASVLKLEHHQYHTVQLDLNFNIRGCDHKFMRFLTNNQSIPNLVDIFTILPSLKINLWDLLMQFKNKGISQQFYQNMQINLPSNKSNSLKSTYKTLKFDVEQQLYYLEQLQTQDTIGKTQQNVDYQLQLYLLSEIVNDIPYEYSYYEIKIYTSGYQEQQGEKTQKQLKSSHKETPEKQLINYKTRIIDGGSVKSKGSTVTIVRIADDLNTMIHSHVFNRSVLRIFSLTMLSLVSVIGLTITISLLFQIKRNQQDVCFNKLSYGTEFLDAYSRLLKGSRHTVFYRDFNKFLKQSQLIQISQDVVLNISLADKLTYSFNNYFDAATDLVTLYNVEKKLLAEYQDYLEINYKFINYDATQIITQVIQTQAAYYEMMNSLFYLAIKSFASDPSLYLKGNIDNFSQISTRSILFLNFKDVCKITTDFIAKCLENSTEYNNTYDAMVTYLFIVFYSFFILIHLLQSYSFYLLINKIKIHLAIFQRIDYKEVKQEIVSLSELNDQINEEEFWLNNTVIQSIQNIQTIQSTNQQNTKITNLKLYEQFNIKSLYIIQTISTLSILIYLVIFQVLYQNYSTQINPIVNTALQVLQIRLNFINTVNQWEIQNYKIYYQNFKALYEQDINFNQNIVGDLKILSLVELDLTELEESMQSLYEEPFSRLINYQNQDLKSSLLYQDLCLIMDCSMETKIFKSRKYTEQLAPFFEDGLIVLYQQISQIILGQKYFKQEDDKLQTMQSFEELVESSSYFVYIIWGLDATNFQLKLFSEYFIDLAKLKLSELTSSILIYCIVLGLLIIGIVSMLIYFILNISTNNYMIARSSIQLIPLRIIILKSLIKQFKQIQ